MTLLYKPSAVKSHFDTSGKLRYIARPCKRKVIKTSELSRMISKRSTLSQADVAATLYAFEELIPELLLDNNSVHLKPLGVFSLSFKSNVEDEEVNITHNSITDIRLQFRPDAILKQKLKNATLKKSSD